MNKKLTYSLILVVLTLAISVTAALAASKTYHGTTVTYTNRILDQGDCCWNGGYSDSTSPSLSMDIFGPSVWTTYVSCNGVPQYDTVTSYSNQYQYNKTSIGDGMARVKSPACTGQKPRRLHDYVQHYWQDGAYGGDGGTIEISVIK